VLTVTRTEIYQEAVCSGMTRAASTAWRTRPSAGPYHTCGDCNCGAKKKKSRPAMRRPKTRAKHPGRVGGSAGRTGA